MKMLCPLCNQVNPSGVISSRISGNGRSVRRRRVCSGCQERFTTYEVEKYELQKLKRANEVRQTIIRLLEGEGK